MSAVAARITARLARWLAPEAHTAWLTWLFAGRAPGARTLNPRIKSLSGVRSQEFTGVHAAGRTAYVYPSELVRTAVNCNPNCNPGFSRPSGLVVRGGGEPPIFRFSGVA
jgi:hypothetical protein